MVKPRLVSAQESAPNDIAARLERSDPGARLEAARLIRDLDKAISHCIAVKGSLGLSPWASGVLHDAVTRQKARDDADV